MGFAKRYVETTIKIIKEYRGNIPFHLYLKKYFAANKKFGSKDRKQIASLSYNYYRLGNAFPNTPLQDKILLGTFLCENKRSEILKELKPEWSDLIEEPIETKLAISNTQSAIRKILPYKNELSQGIDVEKFSKSFLIQPDLFLRVRPGNLKRVTGKLSGAGLPYKLISENCIALPNSSKVDTIIELDKEAVVQDLNSQRVGELIQLSIANCQLPISIWDCCAASGGKSIMAYDINPDIELTVSDKRETILENLHNRFAKAGIKKYQLFVVDLMQDKLSISASEDDLIIADVPCTGSGTWVRTPERLLYFRNEQIEKYTSLQKKIIQNVIPHLKKGGHLLYVTCSVFKKENEEIVTFIQEELHLTLINMEILKGYEMKADTMFAALFTVPAA